MTHLAFCGVPGMLIALSLLADAAGAQTMALKDRAVGTWTLVSVTVDGPTKAEPYGPSPNGIMFLDGNGRYAVTIVRAGVQKFASNNRTTGTDEENKAAVHGSLAYFGSYTINDAEGSITVKIDGSTFPNFEGQTQKRLIALSGDELTVTNAAPSGGGGVAKQVWKRAK